MKTIIQIGCNDGNDLVYNFTKNLKNPYKIHLVDASSEALNKCKIQYQNTNSSFHYLAITPNNTEYITLFVPENDAASQHSSLQLEHLKKHGHENIKEIQVPAKQINKFLDESHLGSIDYLFIDVEGLDVDLVNAIDFAVFDIKNIRFEILHSDHTFSKGGPKLDNLKQKLMSLGYTLKEDGWDMIAEKS